MYREKECIYKENGSLYVCLDNRVEECFPQICSVLSSNEKLILRLTGQNPGHAFVAKIMDFIASDAHEIKSLTIDSNPLCCSISSTVEEQVFRLLPACNVQHVEVSYWTTTNMFLNHQGWSCSVIESLSFPNLNTKNGGKDLRSFCECVQSLPKLYSLSFKLCSFEQGTQWDPLLRMLGVLVPRLKSLQVDTVHYKLPSRYFGEVLAKSSANLQKLDVALDSVESTEDFFEGIWMHNFPFSQLTELHLNDWKIKGVQEVQCLSELLNKYMPKLHTLSLSKISITWNTSSQLCQTISDLLGSFDLLPSLCILHLDLSQMDNMSARNILENLRGSRLRALIFKLPTLTWELDPQQPTWYPQAVSFLKSCTQVEVLRLDGISVTNELVAVLHSYRFLRVLDLEQLFADNYLIVSKFLSLVTNSGFIQCPVVFVQFCLRNVHDRSKFPTEVTYASLISEQLFSNRFISSLSLGIRDIGYHCKFNKGLNESLMKLRIYVKQNPSKISLKQFNLRFLFPCDPDELPPVDVENPWAYSMFKATPGCPHCGFHPKYLEEFQNTLCTPCE